MQNRTKVVTGAVMNRYFHWMRFAWLCFVLPLVFCSSQSIKDRVLEKVDRYYAAKNRHDFEHPDYAEFKQKVSLTWHGAKEGEGITSRFNPNSGWNQWDVAWNGSYSFSVTAFDESEVSVTGRFNEDNEFFHLIGIPHGLSATVTFWFDEELRVKETQYNWDESNQSVHEKLKPIVAWAITYDSLATHQVYLKDGFVPNAENARIWKKLLTAYWQEHP